MALFTGKTVEAAVETGLKHLGLTRSQVTIRVVAKEKAGFLGFGKKDAQVEVTPLAVSSVEDSLVQVETGRPNSSRAADLGGEDLATAGQMPTRPLSTQLVGVSDENATEPSSALAPQNEEPTGQPLVASQPELQAGLQSAPLAQSEEVLSSPASSEVSSVEEQAPLQPDPDFQPGEVESSQGKLSSGDTTELVTDDTDFDAFVAQEFKSSRQDIAQATQEVLAYVEKIIYEMDVEATIAPSHNRRQITLQIETPEPGRLIGYHGKVLKSLQLLAQNYLHDRYSKNFSLSLNVHDYLEHRTETLIEVAHRVADKVLATGQTYRMDPMSNQERKTIHKTISRISGVESYSEGDDPNRYVVVVSRD